MRTAVRWVVPGLVGIVLAAVVLIIVSAMAGGSKHSSSSSTSPPPAPRQDTTTKTTRAAAPSPKRRRIATPGVPSSGRCGEITVNQHTSCAFAHVVVKDYDAHPSASFTARSPVTGQTYTMHCERAHGIVSCADNSTSTLAFKAQRP
jgi:serine/threonine-protein kinase